MKSSRSSSLPQRSNPIDQYPQYIQDQFPAKNFSYQSIPNNAQGNVYKEILDKYDYKQYPFKGKLANEGGDSAAYDPIKNKIPKLELPDQIQPDSLAHELMHSEDHRKHGAYKNIWQHIQDYASQNKIYTWDNLNKELNFIQNKIDPTKAFSKNYVLNKTDLERETNYVLKNKDQITDQITPNAWNRITETVNQNHSDFPLNYASEYPSYMMERIATPWETNLTRNKVSALNQSQANLLHSMLGSIRDKYSNTSHPQFNQHIRERQSSIEKAYPSGNYTKSVSPTNQQFGGFVSQYIQQTNPYSGGFNNQPTNQQYTQQPTNQFSNQMAENAARSRDQNRQNIYTGNRNVPNIFTQSLTNNQQQLLNRQLPKGYSLQPTNDGQ